MIPELSAFHRSLLEQQSNAAAVVDELFAAGSAASDPILLELCRLRLAGMLGHDQALKARSPKAVSAGLDEEKISRLPEWPTAEVFTGRERACLALAEQFAMDVKGIDQQLIDEVGRWLSAQETFAFIAGLWPVEQQLRLSLTLDRLFGEKEEK